MLVRVRYASGTYDYVNSDILDDLIQSNAISQFFRSGTWATIGIDPIRTNRMAEAQAGPERGECQRFYPSGLGLAKPLFKKVT